MNLFDFDKTIYKKDSSVRFYFFCFKKSAKMFCHFFCVCFFALAYFFHLISLKKFKEKCFSFLKYFDDTDKLVDSFWEREEKNINKWYLDAKCDSDVICSASPQFLVEPIIKKLNPTAKVFCTQMDKNTGKISGENFKGAQKKIELEKRGYTSFENVYTDSMSDLYILDMACSGGGAKHICCGSKVFEFKKQKPTLSVKIKYIIRQLRIKHYIKNLLIFLPLVFAGELSNTLLLKNVLVGFVSLCLMTSAVYTVNDLIDAKNDRLSERKRTRPIACYMIKVHEAIIIAVVLFSASVALNVFVCEFKLLSLLLLLGYATMNLLYSAWLKNVPILDAFLLAFFFMLRLYFGAVSANVAVSNWMYLTILCGSLFMGFGKRRNEICHESGGVRKVNDFYDSKFLSGVIFVSMALCLVFYSLWAINFGVLGDTYLNSKILLFTIPLVYFIMMRYLFDIEKTSSSGDPTDVFFKDFVLIVCALLFAVCICISIYVPIPNFLIG